MVTITSLAKDERSARIVLASTLEPDDALTGRLIAAVGAVETVRLLSTAAPLPTSVDAVEGGLWRQKAAPRLDARLVERVVADTDRLGLGVLIPEDHDWPSGLDDLGDRAPTALWVRGATSLLAGDLRDRVTITGARAATGYGEHVTSELAAAQAAAERVIVSGGAYGIDRTAHASALSVGGQTVAVLAGGLDRLYPAGNQELLGRVGDVGLLVGEMAPGSAPTRWRFLARSRILAAVSAATVIVEAGYRSGALTVVARAAQLGRPIGAVPGPVTSAASGGTHRILRERIASLVTDSTDLSALIEPPARDQGRAFDRDAGMARSVPLPGRTL
ncbi:MULTISPECIES: DNA-processing protein DprA [Micrococcales]|uniref:DNA processing protein n=1 Tax=Brevibacterium aurantiacum TaxID=273384 RepID=A0A2H1KZ08_BREAU|nr:MULTISPECIES: DNA-processing protein DprA [Micrococcales]RCS62105.1 DNA-processing protein DprA [Microbacterium sp. JB110]SJM53194.1 Rossmann fold nucleotide-binding protein Smf possibly involved in DNA uptake [Frigoribacterium sp. JB110]SMY05015.1 DNA processing protein [Brevibacterium aurantiacum]